MDTPQPSPAPQAEAGAALAAASRAVSSAAEVAPGGLQDIRGPLPVDGFPPFALSGAVLLLAGATLAARRFARRPGALPPLPPPSAAAADPAGEVARLGHAYRGGSCSGEQAIVRLDALVRDALAVRAGIPARCLTSTELLRHPALLAPDGERARALLSRLGAVADRVKFGGHRPVPGEVEAALAAVASWLEAVPARSAS